jgi:hypothetical protein
MLIYTQTSLSIRNTEIPRQKANEEWELGKDVNTLILRTRELGIQLLGSQMYRSLALGGSRDGLLEALFIVSTVLRSCRGGLSRECRHTSFSKTQLLSSISGFRHSHRFWLLFSRHSQ